MKNLYDFVKENPDIVADMELSESDIAAANYLFSMTSLVKSEIREQDDGAWVHVNSTYNEAVANVIENHPKAVKFILSLSEGYGIFKGGIDSQFAYLLVKDYLENNFDSGPKRHSL